MTLPKSSALLRAMLLGASAFTIAATVATPAMAQLTTSTIRGTVSNGTAVTPGAVVTAVNVDTNATTRSTAGTDGSYVLTGLSPGTYDISVGGAKDAAPSTQRVIIGVGETATLDLDTAATAAPATADADAAGKGVIVVTGRRLTETKTSEVASNISRQQIENLPQGNRNFLDFAALAPGIRILKSEGRLRQTFGGGGVGLDPNGDSFGGPQVNVFIDGVSLKSNVNQGGVDRPGRQRRQSLFAARDRRIPRPDLQLQGGI